MIQSNLRPTLFYTVAIIILKKVGNYEYMPLFTISIFAKAKKTKMNNNIKFQRVAFTINIGLLVENILSTFLFKMSFIYIKKQKTKNQKTNNINYICLSIRVRYVYHFDVLLTDNNH